MRASNGRLHFYDVPCLPRGAGRPDETGAGRAVATGAAAHPREDQEGSLAPALQAYNEWRRAHTTAHLFELVSQAILAKHPETARRRGLAIAVPR